MDQLSDIKTILGIVIGICAIIGYLWKIAKEIPRKKAILRILERFPQVFDEDMRTTRAKLQNGDNLDRCVKHVVAETTLKKVEANKDYYDFLKTKVSLLYGQIPRELVSLFLIVFLFVGVFTFTAVWSSLPVPVKDSSAPLDAAQIATFLKENNLFVQFSLLVVLPTVAGLVVSLIAHAFFVHVQVVRGSLRIFRAAGVAKVSLGKIIEIVDADNDPDFKDIIS